jgi:methionyl aminopeptidase
LIKNRKELDGMYFAGERLAKVFSRLSFPFIINKTTKEIDSFIHSVLDELGMVSCTYGYKGFKGYSCISLNNQLVHGLPSSNKTISEFDLVKIDICASYNGFCADAARPYAFFDANSLFKKMYTCAQLSLDKGIGACTPSHCINDIAYEIEKEILSHGFSVVVDFAGHGIGRNMHEDPEVPNFYQKNKKTQTIYSGMAFAIEPMFCQFSNKLIVDEDDKWTVSTVDLGYAMHIEDTVVVDNDRTVITTRI